MWDGVGFVGDQPPPPGRRRSSSMYESMMPDHPRRLSRRATHISDDDAWEIRPRHSAVSVQDLPDYMIPGGARMHFQRVSSATSQELMLPPTTYSPPPNRGVTGVVRHSRPLELPG